MMWPNVDNTQQNKIFGHNNADKLGLYGNIKAPSSALGDFGQAPPHATKSTGNLGSHGKP